MNQDDIALGMQVLIWVNWCELCRGLSQDRVNACEGKQHGDQPDQQNDSNHHTHNVRNRWGNRDHAHNPQITENTRRIISRVTRRESMDSTSNNQMAAGKIKVPDELSKAVGMAHLAAGGYPLTEYGVLEVVCRWIVNEIHTSKLNHSAQDVANLFLAPEPEIPEDESVYGRVAKAVGNVTLTRAQGDTLIEFIKGAIHDRDSEPVIPEGSRICSGRTRAMEIVGADRIDYRIIEAYNRGLHNSQLVKLNSR